VDVIEAALRRYPGRALINSISLESAKVDLLLKIAKKYGAMFILLPLSDAGLPQNQNEKIQMIKALLEKAYALGLKKEDIIVDGLVTTVGANPKAAMETLETIQYCKEHQLATICGLSNISFGLPERSFINTAFLTMAIQAGLTMAIANPSQDLLVNCAMASDLLLNKEEAAITYINRIAAWKEKADSKKPEKVSVNQVKADEPVSGNQTLLHIKEAVLKGNKRGIVDLVKAGLSEGLSAEAILNQALLIGINEVGELFDKGKYFLPQLISGAEDMKYAIEYIEPLLREDNGREELPTIVIATVKGDIHDIGKNLVALMLKNHGFRVIDLGKDVDRDVIIDAALKEKADVIALSALMTTTMQEMRQVIACAKAKNCKAKIIIGGAVITQDYADEIGADGYSTDAADAVRLTQKILGL